MPLKQKISLILVMTVAVYAGLDYGIQRYIVMPSFLSLEREEARKDMQRCVGAIDREVQHLDTLCVDWAARNDMYEYVHNHIQKYEENNLNEETFKANNLNLLLLFGPDGGLLWGEAYRQDHQHFGNVGEVQDIFVVSLEKLLNHRSPTSVVKGITRTKFGPLLIASRPIITSEHTGPIRGTLIMGRFLDEALVSNISDQTCVPLEVWPIQPDTMPPEHAAALAAIGPIPREHVVEQDSKQLSVFATMSGIDGQGALLLQTKIARHISARGTTANRIALGSIIVAGGILLLLVLGMLERAVVRPLSELTRHVSGIGHNWELPPNKLTAMAGKNEIGVLARQFDSSIRELHRRDRLLAGVAEVGQCLLSRSDAGAVAQALEILGRADDVNRAYIFENHQDPQTGRLLMSQRYEWAAESVSAEIDNPEMQNLPYDRLEGMYEALSAGRSFGGLVKNLPVPMREMLEAQQIVSLLLVPVAVGGRFWGFIGFDECRKERQWTETEVSLLTAAAGTFGSAILQHLAEEAMLEARHAAERANTHKSDFLARMSHEIRTPINGVVGMAHLLTHTALTDQQQRYVRVIQSSADSLLTVINDILDISKIEAGKLDLHPVDFDLRSLVEDVAEVFAQRAAQKGLELATVVEPAVPRRVRGDADRFRQILVNLVGNALKFTERGEVVVRARLLERTDAKATIHVAVRDTGIGIPPERLPELFQSFSQVDSSDTRKHGGTGLGLAISKRLVEMMGGRIGVDSQPGVGSTFWFTAEMDVLQAAPVATAAEATLSLLRHLRVLAVDDSAAGREALWEQLHGWGFDAETADNGLTALTMLREATAAGAPFGLVIFTAQMPGMNGLELCRAIRSDPQIHRSVRIIMTLIDEPVDAQTMVAEGIDLCLTKPVRQSKLFDAIAEAVARAAGLWETPVGAAAAEPKPSLASRAQGAWILLAEDNDVNQEMVREILRVAGCYSDIARNGAEAVEALSKKPYDLVLMDCQMPEMDGLEATRRIREKEAAGAVFSRRGGRIPILALTANAIGGERERCLAAGMDGYIAKPVAPEGLIGAIDAQLAPRDETAPAAPQQPPKTSPEPPAPARAIELPELLQRCMGNKDCAASVLEKFLEQLPESARRLADAIASGEAAEAARLAHTLRGAAANLAAPGLRDAVTEIERRCRNGDVNDASSDLSRFRREADLFVENARQVLAELSAGGRGQEEQRGGVHADTGR